ncbi:hypothetical protein B0H14DRAFT_3147712 [Mycena olivaceomarginata]|nr:hypothetical protein B0H14DRAFT_3147712 [Mycena olivaceomarginata]
MSLDQKHGAAHAGCTQTRNKRGFGRFEVAAEGAAAAAVCLGRICQRAAGRWGHRRFQRRAAASGGHQDAKTLCWQNTEELACFSCVLGAQTPLVDCRDPEPKKEAKKPAGCEDRVERHLEDSKTAFEVLWGVWAGGGSKDVSNTADQITTWHIIV